MTSEDVREKNERIKKLVMTLIWHLMGVLIVLGIIFPVSTYLALNSIFLTEQMVTAKMAQTMVSDTIATKKRLLSFAAGTRSVRTANFSGLLQEELRGIPENELPELRGLFQHLLNSFSSFRYFSYLTYDSVRPYVIHPYQTQLELTLSDYQAGFAYREWARKTHARYEVWNGTGPIEPYVSNAFLSKPGLIPGVSVSVTVINDDKQPVGILYANIILDKLSDFVKNLSFGKTGRVFLVDAEGFLLAHPTISAGREVVDEEGNKTWELRSVADHPVVANALQGRFSPGVFRLTGESKAVLATCLTVPDTGWIIVVEQETAEILNRVKLYWIVVIVLVFLTIAVSAVVFIMIARETAETTREHDELIVISETDPLTGLLNRRSMLSRMVQFVQNYQETKQPFVIALFDIDDFKLVNDTHGHVFGDLVLREIAARTASVLRVDDLLFRWGGEEFLVVVKNCNLLRGKGIAEKIRRVVADAPISDDRISISITVTLGVCEYQGGSIDALIIHADEALYEGKRTGKNRVVGASSDADLFSSID